MKLADVDAIVGQGENAVSSLQPHGQRIGCITGIDNVDFAADVWPGAVGVNIEPQLARTAHVGIEQLGDLEIDCSLEQEGHGRIACYRDRSLKLEIRVGAANCAALHIHNVVFEVDLNGRGGGELDVAGVGKPEIGDGGVRFKQVLVLEGTVQGGVQFGFAGDGIGRIGSIGCDERLQRNSLRVERGVCGVVAGEADASLGLYGTLQRRGRQGCVGNVVGHIQLQVELFNGLLLDDQRGDLDGRIQLRIIESSLAIGMERNGSGGVDISGLQVLNLVEADTVGSELRGVCLLLGLDVHFALQRAAGKMNGEIRLGLAAAAAEVDVYRVDRLVVSHDLSQRDGTAAFGIKGGSMERQVRGAACRLAESVVP